MRTWVLFLAAAAAVILAPVRATAWNDAGHKTIALFAYRELDDGTRAKLIKILEKHPHYDIFLKKGQPQGVDRGEWLVMQAATWPDWVRPKKKHPRPEIEKYHHGPWHYIDKPFVLPGEKKLDEAALEPKAPHVVSALGDCVAELKKPATTEQEAQARAVTLCWLLHLVGDIHQPLHAAQLYSDQFPPPEGDRGGNYFFVPNSKHIPELHAYWDSLLGRDARSAAVDLVAEDLRHTRAFTRKALKKYLAKTAFAGWAAESHYYARKLAYLDGQLKGVSIAPAPDGRHEVGHVAPLTADYERNAVNAARRRGALAGHRLADQLTALFGKGGSQKPNND
jgi:hypothetical protein